MATLFRSSTISDVRLDPWHHQPTFTEALSKIEASGQCRPLAALIDPARGIAGGATPLGADYAETGTVRFYRTADVRDMIVDGTRCVWLTEKQDGALTRSRLAIGDVILTITGVYFGQSGVVNTAHLPGNISQHSVRFALKALDAHYLTAYLSSQCGQLILWQRAYGATRPAIDYPALRSLPIREPLAAAQKYIGDKVRHAERLRSWTRRLSEYTLAAVDAYMSGRDRATEIEQALARGSRWNQIPANLRCTNPINGARQPAARVPALHLASRLDCSYYAKDAMEVDLRLSQGYETAALADVVDPSRQITNGVRGPAFQPSAFKLVRLQDREGWSIDFDKCASISEAQFRENRRCELREDDVVVAIGGYIGHAAMVRRVQPAVIGQHSAVLPMGSASRIDEGFLVAYFCSHDGAAQLKRYVSGTVQAGINLEDLREVRVPTPSLEFQRHIGDAARRADDLSVWSRRLCMAATQLVDALIEQKITEAELVDIQRALESGDEEPDRCIMARLTAGGIDAPQQSPLFADLDALYAAIHETIDAGASHGEAS